MRRLLGLFILAVMFIGALQAQTPSTPIAISLPEFRQVLVDLGTYLDARRGTNLANQFSTMPEDALSKIYASVPNPMLLKNSVASLKQHATEMANGATPVPRLHALVQRAGASNVTPLAVVGSCAPGSIIDNSPNSTCTPSYPDPTNTAWQNMVNPVITFGGFSPSDYVSVSSQQCGLTVESNLVQVVSALDGTVSAASIACDALQAIPVAGTIAAGVCSGAVAIVATAGAVSQGLLADCSEQDGNVNSAEIDAGFHNTVTIFNALGSLGTQLTNVSTQIDTMLSTDDGGITTLLGGLSSNLSVDTNLINTNLSTDTTLINSNLSTDTSGINNNIAAVNKLVNNGFSSNSTQIANLSTATTNGFGAVNNTLFINNNQVTAEFAAISTQLTNLVTQLQTQIASTAASQSADDRQTWKLLMTPDGQKVLNPAMLTCTGTNCPNVLAKCPAAGCSWNNVGPLP